MKYYLNKFKSFFIRFKKLSITAHLSLIVIALLILTIGITINNALTPQGVRTRAANAAMSINNIVIRSVKTDSFVVEWDSTEGGTSQIIGEGITSLKELFSYFHMTEVKNLKPGTVYNFRIQTIDRNGVTRESPVQTVTTKTQEQLNTLIKDARKDKGLAQTYYIKPNGNNALDGKTTATAWKTLAYAVTRVDVGDTINVMDGTYNNDQAVITRATAKNGTDFAPITIKAYGGNPTFIMSPRFAANSSVVRFENMAWWNIDGITAKSYWRAIFLNYESHHINITNTVLDDYTAGFFAANKSHHILTKNITMRNGYHNSWYIWMQTHHIIADNVNISLQYEHSYFDIHSNDDTSGINHSYITIWNSTAYDAGVKYYNPAPIYIHPYKGYDKYISIINFKARNVNRMVLDLEGPGDSLYADGIQGDNTMGIFISYLGKNTVIKNVVINMKADPSGYGSGGHGFYIWATKIEGLKLENITINGVNTAKGSKIFFNGTPNVVSGLEIINSFGTSTSTPTPTSPANPTPTYSYITPTIYCLGSCPTLIPTPSSPTPIKKVSPCGSYGDINNDGFITAEDGVLVLMHVGGFASYNLTDSQKTRADVNGDGSITQVDGILITKYAEGQSVTFDVCSKAAITPSSAPNSGTSPTIAYPSISGNPTPTPSTPPDSLIDDLIEMLKKLIDFLLDLIKKLYPGYPTVTPTILPSPAAPTVTSAPGSCPINPTGKIIVAFPRSFIRSDTTQRAAQLDPVTTSIPAGSYDVTLVSFDDHINKPNQVQTDEKWYLKLGVASGTNINYIASSNSTNDLPDNNDWLTQKVNTNLNLPENITSALAVHSAYPNSSSPNSIFPVCAAFEPVTGDITGTPPPTNSPTNTPIPSGNPTNTPIPTLSSAPTNTISPTPVANKQIILLDTTYTHTTTSKAFSFFDIPSWIPSNLVSPINYSNGKLYQRMQIITKPSTKSVFYQMCIFQDKIVSEKHACSGGPKFTSTGTYYYNQTLKSFYQYNVIDWKRKLLNTMLVVKDGNGQPVDDRYGFAGKWNGSPNFGLYYPMKVRYTAILMPPGSGEPVWPN